MRMLFSNGVYCSGRYPRCSSGKMGGGGYKRIELMYCNTFSLFNIFMLNSSEKKDFKNTISTDVLRHR